MNNFYSFPEDLPPYWRNETSGRLEKSVLAYFAPYATDETPPPLSSEDLDNLKQYLCLYVSAPCWRKNPHADRQHLARLDELQESARNLASREDITQFIYKCMDIALDPF